MKIPGLIALALLSSGCALFQGDAASEAALLPQPAASPASTRTAFRPAYATGRPIALVRCRQGSTLNDDCVAGETRHQVGDEDTAPDSGSAVIDVSLPADSK